MNALVGPVCAVLAMAGFGAVQNIDTTLDAKTEGEASWQAVPLAVRPVVTNGEVRSAVLMEFGVTVRDGMTADAALIEALAQDAFQTAVRSSMENDKLATFDDAKFRDTFLRAVAVSGGDDPITNVTVTLLDERAVGLLRQPSS